MPSRTAAIIQDRLSVEDTLRQIGLTSRIVEHIAESAAAGRAEALAVDPVGTPGQLSYIHGVRAIRLNLFPLGGWRESRPGNVESTVNDSLGIQLCFQNVDSACDVTRVPQAISRKGAAARNLVEAGQRDLFDEANRKRIDKHGSSPTVWVVCVAVTDDAVRAEVSCPTSFEGEQFEDFHQRVFVLDQPRGPDLDSFDSDVNPFDDLDVVISRK